VDKGDNLAFISNKYINQTCCTSSYNFAHIAYPLPITQSQDDIAEPPNQQYFPKDCREQALQATGMEGL
jgi:hypothetical protein